MLFHNINVFFPFCRFNFHIGKLSPSYFYISETSVKNIIKPIANLWNQGVYILRSIAQGRDGRLFLKVGTYFSEVYRIQIKKRAIFKILYERTNLLSIFCTLLRLI